MLVVKRSAAIVPASRDVLKPSSGAQAVNGLRNMPRLLLRARQLGLSDPPVAVSGDIVSSCDEVRTVVGGSLESSSVHPGREAPAEFLKDLEDARESCPHAVLVERFDVQVATTFVSTAMAGGLVAAQQRVSSAQ